MEVILYLQLEIVVIASSGGATTLTVGLRADTAFGYYAVNSNGEVTSKTLCP